MLTGRLNCWVSPVHAPCRLVQAEPAWVQSVVVGDVELGQRLKPPLLLPCQRILPWAPPAVVFPRVGPFAAKFALLILAKGTVLPVAPGDLAVTMTVAPFRTAVAVPGISRLIEVTMLLPSVVVLVLRTTLPVAVPEVTKVKV